MRDLRVTLVQSDIYWQSVEKNLRAFEKKLAPLAGQTDLVLLPEMFSTGFSMEPELHAEPVDGPSTEWMVEQAERLGAAVMGSVPTATSTGYVNRLLFCVPGKDPVWYDKRHLFRMGGEHNHYSAGSKRVVLGYQGWRILPLVCYDLRFPVFARNCNDYDLMVCVANWPAPRRQPWRTLLQARAIENQCYVAGVNRIGRDGKGVEYSGDSMLVGFKGELMIDRGSDQEFIATHTLDAGALELFRESFPAWMDADRFELLD